PYCGRAKLVRGVMDRILSLSDRTEPRLPADRPPYRYQVPLAFLPGLGKRTLDKLLDEFGTEMNILHRVPAEALERFVGPKLADLILKARHGELDAASGGGGTYGKIRPGQA